MEKKKTDSFIVKGIAEFCVYFLATLGFSDFALNTLVFKKAGWVDDKRLTSTMITCYLVPGIIIAFVYLTGETAFDLKTLFPCVAFAVAGMFFGSGKMLQLDGAKLRRIVGYAMIFAMIALIVRLVVSRGASGTANGLHGWQFVFVLPLILVLGYAAPFGVPMKPTMLALFLILGITPLATLTYIMVITMCTSFTGNLRILRSGQYEKSLFKAASTFGAAGAIIGSMFALSINPFVLTIIMLFIMAFVVYTMLKPQ